MNRSRIYRAFDEFLKDSNLSLRAKGFLTMALTNNITQGLDVEKYCTDSKEDIKDTLLELRILMRCSKVKASSLIILFNISFRPNI